MFQTTNQYSLFRNCVVAATLRCMLQKCRLHLCCCRYLRSCSCVVPQIVKTPVSKTPFWRTPETTLKPAATYYMYVYIYTYNNNYIYNIIYIHTIQTRFSIAIYITCVIAKSYYFPQKLVMLQLKTSGINGKKNGKGIYSPENQNLLVWLLST